MLCGKIHSNNMSCNLHQSTSMCSMTDETVCMEMYNLDACGFDG